MVHTGKFAGMFYEIDGAKVELEVIENYDNRPSTYIGKQFYIDNDAFWNFVWEASIEMKREYSKRVENEDGEFSPDQINKFKLLLDQFIKMEEIAGDLVKKKQIKIE